MVPCARASNKTFFSRKVCYSIDIVFMSRRSSAEVLELDQPTLSMCWTCSRECVFEGGLGRVTVYKLEGDESAVELRSVA
jgi:hypothetical protein